MPETINSDFSILMEKLLSTKVVINRYSTLNREYVEYNICDPYGSIDTFRHIKTEKGVVWEIPNKPKTLIGKLYKKEIKLA